MIYFFTLLFSFNDVIYEVRDCMLPSRAFYREVFTLRTLTSIGWFLWVGLVSSLPFNVSINTT